MKRPFFFTFLFVLTILNSNLFCQVAPFLQRIHTNTKISTTDMPYRLCVPVGYDTNQSYPLVLFLHGAGERGTNNTAQLTANQGATLWAKEVNQNTYPCFVLAPQCANGKLWVDTNWGLGSYNQDKIPISEQLSMVLDILNSLQNEFKINSLKIYVTGLSMGGYGTWDLITRFPTKFAAAIPICGAGDPSKASLLGALPIRVFASSDDGTVPVSGSRDMVNAINALGPNNRSEFYTEYTDQGHGSWVNAYNTTNLVSWLFTSKPITYTLTNIQNQKSNAKIYIQNGKLVSDLSSMSGDIQISVFDSKGSKINSIQSKGLELLKFNVINKGLYLVRVQNGDKEYVQKVVL